MSIRKSNSHPKNEMVADINSHVLDKILGDSVTYYGSNSICQASSSITEDEILYPLEFLNTVNLSDKPNYSLISKKRNTCNAYKELKPNSRTLQ